MILSLRKKRYVSIVVPIFLMALVGIFYLTTQEKIQIVADGEAEKVTCGDQGQYHEQIQCWVNSIKEIIKSKGMHAAFAAMSDRFMNEPSFKRSCNEILHDVGHWTYHETAHDNITFSVPPHITICAHAFDRAFAHELTATTGDFSKAIKFCIDPQLASESPEATASCSHGIGHGAFSFYASTMIGERPQVVIARALEECTKIAHTPLGLDYCTGGVFAEVVHSYQAGSHGLALNKEDPFLFCREQAESYKRMCYASAKPLLLWLTNSDFSKAASFIERIEEDGYASVAIDALTNSVTAGNITRSVRVVDYIGDIFACRKIQERLRQPCIAGLAIELLTHSSPADALEFCRLPLLADEERDACFRRIVPHFSEWIPRDQIQQICSSLEEKYRNGCGR